MTSEEKQLSLHYPVLETKLFIPEIKSEVVLRKRLVDRLNNGMDKRLILISAPAGFGKTTLLSEWISQIETPAAWISIDASDNDPICFVRYVIAALQKIEPDFANDVLEILKSPHSLTTDSIILFLIKKMERFPYRFILALDDYHLINTLQINRIFELLLDRMPQQMCLVISTRADPGFPFSRLRVTNQLTEIRISELYFTKEETTLFFKQVMRLNLAQKDIDRLISRTEGWAAGLQLAALSMMGQEDVSVFIDNFAGSDRFVADYLAEEVLSRQSEDIQDFLLKTSILHRFSAPLCEFVTGQKKCQVILEDLEQDNLFLVPLDNKRQWYRYHHLFADLLKQRLLQRTPEQVSQIQLRACDWFEANGYKEEAIERALSGQNFERAAKLIENYLEVSWQGGEQVTLLNWYEVLPEKIILSHPNLCISYARVLFESGRQELAQDYLQRIETSNEVFQSKSESNSIIQDSKSDEPGSNQIQGRIAALKTYWATLKGDLENIALYSQQALSLLQKDDAEWRMMVMLGAAITHEVKGDVTEAIKKHYDAIDAAKQAGSVYFYLITRVWLAIELNILGRMPEAIGICKELLKEVENKTLALSIGKGHVFGTYGEIIYERNALDESYHYAKKGIALLEEGHDIHHIGWRYATLGRILCSRHDVAAASALVDRMEELLATNAVPPWVASKSEAVRARIWLIERNTKAIESWVEQNKSLLEGCSNRFFEAKYIEFARMLTLLERYDEAQKIISPMLIKQERDCRLLNQLETLMVQTRIFNETGRVDEAVKTLNNAISIASPGGYLRVFADEGQLVYDLLDKFSDTQIEKQKSFIMKLQADSNKRKTINFANGLVEQLSEREMDVLSLVSAGLSNKKIAESLFISVNTLKTHLQNIYGKLGVHNRTEAVFKAKELRLLD
ncbi:MAG: LuxR C-terminal-related transcriptional regulator [Desulfobacterales bacterium]|nr:LuxR C-terminal-related transcriptional regulator [Desulfobacterales bacterium]